MEENLEKNNGGGSWEKLCRLFLFLRIKIFDVKVLGRCFCYLAFFKTCDVGNDNSLIYRRLVISLIFDVVMSNVQAKTAENLLSLHAG